MAHVRWLDRCPNRHQRDQGIPIGPNMGSLGYGCTYVQHTCAPILELLTRPAPRIRSVTEPITDEDTEQLMTAAVMYYEQSASQQEIARRLGVSRPTVSRLLARAREIGIVRIEIVAPQIDPRARGTSARPARAARPACGPGQGQRGGSRPAAVRTLRRRPGCSRAGQRRRHRLLLGSRGLQREPHDPPHAARCRDRPGDGRATPATGPGSSPTRSCGPGPARSADAPST